MSSASMDMEAWNDIAAVDVLTAAYSAAAGPFQSDDISREI